MMENPIVSLRFKTDDKQIKTLCSSYWEQNEKGEFVHKVAALSKRFKIPSYKLSKSVTENSDAFTDKYVCCVCQAPYLFLSRSALQFRESIHPNWKCQKCLSIEQAKVEQERIIREQNFRKLIKESYGSNAPGPVDIDDLSMEEAVYLLSFIRLFASEDFSYARSFNSDPDRLSPTQDFSQEILDTLYERNLIFVNSDSPADAFTGERAERFYTFKVMWNLPYGYSSEDPKDFVCELEEMLRNNSWPDSWIDESIELWEKVALNECLQYLIFSLKEHGFEFSPGEKTVLAVRNLLQEYSAAQVFSIIWRSVKDAAAYYVREKVTRKHAANLAISALQRFGEHAKVEKWDIKPYSRSWSLPQSVVSQVLFDLVLEIGEMGFTHCPDISLIDKNYY